MFVSGASGDMVFKSAEPVCPPECNIQPIYASCQGYIKDMYACTFVRKFEHQTYDEHANYLVKELFLRAPQIYLTKDIVGFIACIAHNVPSDLGKQGANLFAVNALIVWKEKLFVIDSPCSLTARSSLFPVQVKKICQSSLTVDVSQACCAAIKFTGKGPEVITYKEGDSYKCRLEEMFSPYEGVCAIVETDLLVAQDNV
jgi:hypothetical protein